MTYPLLKKYVDREPAKLWSPSPRLSSGFCFDFKFGLFAAIDLVIQWFDLCSCRVVLQIARKAQTSVEVPATYTLRSSDPTSHRPFTVCWQAGRLAGDLSPSFRKQKKRCLMFIVLFFRCLFFSSNIRIVVVIKQLLLPHRQQQAFYQNNSNCNLYQATCSKHKRTARSGLAWQNNEWAGKNKCNAETRPEQQQQECYLALGAV